MGFTVLLYLYTLCFFWYTLTSLVYGREEIWRRKVWRSGQGPRTWNLHIDNPLQSVQDDLKCLISAI
jgi:hypothetical protein